MKGDTMNKRIPKGFESKKIKGSKTRKKYFITNGWRSLESKKQHRKILVITVLCLLVLTGFAVFTFQNQPSNPNPIGERYFYSDFVGVITESTRRETKGILHAPIHINGSADFANQAQQEGWSGNGTEENPYIIADYEINGHQGYGIHIENIWGVYFVIRNCTVWNSIRGIYLYNVKDGTLENNNCSGNGCGIYLCRSDNNEILGNNCSNNYYGIYLDDACSSNNITNNNCSDNSDGGIYIRTYSSYWNRIANNTLWNNGITIWGYYFGWWISLVIENNTVNGKPVYFYKNLTGGVVPSDAGQVILANCTNTIITGLNIANVSRGIQLGFCQYITITNNSLVSNSDYGIYIFSSNYNNITNNYCSGSLCGIWIEDSQHNNINYNNCTSCFWAGIYLQGSDYNNITNNQCSNSWDGIYLGYARNNTILNNNCSGNRCGISLASSSNTNITNNILWNNGIEIWGQLVDYWTTHVIENNTVNGKPVYYYKNQNGGNVPSEAGQVILGNCTNMVVSGLTLTHASIGVQLGFSSNNTITNNNCSGNSIYGIDLEYSSNNTITNNHCIGNSEEGILLWSSSNNNITNNTCLDNLWRGIYLSFSGTNNIMNNTLWNNGIVIYGWTLEDWNTHTIENNTVNGKPVYYYKNKNGGTVPRGAGQVILANCTNISVSGLSLTNASIGVQLGFSSYNTITNNNCSGNFIYGIDMEHSSNNAITSNQCTANGESGIYFSSSNNNTITDNHCSNNGEGIYLYSSSNNNITKNNCSNNFNDGIYLYYFSMNNNITYNDFYHNTKYAINFTLNCWGNTVHHNNFWQNNGAGRGISGNCQAFDYAGSNYWCDNITKEGNYWSNWDGSGWGTPNAYPIDGRAGAYDMYPQKEPVSIVTAPSVPQNLDAVAGNGKVTLSWQPPASDGGLPVINYTVYYGTNTGNYTQNIIVGNITTYTVYGLSNGQTYYFAVSAINAVGESAKSNEVSAVPCTVPSPPQNLTVIAGNRNVTLTWEPPADNGGMAVTNYTVYYGTSPGNYTNNITLGNITNYTITGLINGQRYYFAVSAINAVGESPKSNEVFAMPCTVPSAPQNLTAVAGNGNVTLTWQPPADNGGSPITGYKIYYGTSAGNYTTSITVGNITSYTITNLTNGQKYYFAVSAINAVGEGPKSNEASATPAAEQQHGKTPGFDVLVGICAIAVSMVVMAIWRKKSR